MTSVAIKTKSVDSITLPHIRNIGVGGNARYIEEQFEAIAQSMLGIRLYDEQKHIQYCQKILEKGYATAEYISKCTGVELGEIEAVLAGHSRFRKSIMQTKDNRNLYMLDSPFAGIKDFIAYYRWLNFWKI